MALSSLLLRRLVSSNVVSRSISVVRPSAASRLFNTNAVRSFEEADDGVESNHRSNRSVSRSGGDFFSDLLDPFTSTRSLNQVPNLLDKFIEISIVSSTRGIGASGVIHSWEVKEKDDALYLRIDMPGLSKEDVKLSLEQNTLVIKGEGITEEDETSRTGLPKKVYKTAEIKAEMKNGVLKVVIPKMKEEERNNDRHIQVDIEFENI